jgi:predicted metal-dependent peptidase
MIDLDYAELDKAIDRVKTKVFLGNNAAFLGPLMCSLNFSWTSDHPTAQTNGLSLYWNPVWFLKLPPETRLTVLMHEIWHVAFLHMVRRGTRNPKVWNYACDIMINNMLKKEGYSFAGTKPWINADYGEQLAEEIYDALIALGHTSGPLEPMWGVPAAPHMQDPDMDLMEPEDTGIDPRDIAAAVVQATTQAKMAGASEDGTVSDVETMLKRFLQPKLPWHVLLNRFMAELVQHDYSWAKPNRRYQDMYLPSVVDEDGGLQHLMYYLDVSGSVSDGEVIRFNSEVKFVKETFNPRRLTLVLFDNVIQRVYEFYENDEFNEVVIVGRGGTNLAPVREHMLENRPTAAIIFSDLQCHPMEPLPNGIEIPTIWIAVNARKDSMINFGKITHIKE